MPFPARLTRASVDIPLAQRTQLVASGAISENDIVIVNGRSGGLMRVVRADADAVLTARGHLWVALSAAVNGAVFEGVPWRFVRDVNTSTWAAAGDPVYMSGTAGAVSAAAGAFAVQVGECLEVSATTGAYILVPNGSFGGGGAVVGLGGLTLTINDDAAAGTDEDPAYVMLGGDGAEIVRSRWYQDSSADALYMATSLSSVAATGSDRTTNLTVGPSGSANAAGNDIDSIVTLRYHVAGDVVATWRTFTLAADAGNNALQISGSHAAALIDIDAGGALSLNSSGGVINIGNDAVAQAINLGTGAAARTITVGNVTGATAVVVNAGTGASSWTVTGAGTFSLVGGTGLLGIGNNAADHALTIGSVTGVSAFTAQAGTGAMTFTAGGIYDVNAVGAVTIDSSGAAIGIGSDAVAQAINIGIGAAARTITVGNVTGATAVVINAGTGASSWTVTGAGTFSLIGGTGLLGIGNNAADHALTIGSVTGVSAMTVQAGTGAMTFTAGGAYDVNAVGALTIDSSGAAISIGSDAVAQAINVGTGAAARTITIGNVTGATAVVLNAGTGASSWTMTGAGTFSLVGGTGAIGLGNNAADHAMTVGGVTGVSAMTVQAGTGAMTFTAGGAYDVNAVGAVTIDSSGAAISIGSDAVAQAINIGIGAAARTITVGNVTGATAVVVNAGTGASSWTVTGAGTFSLVGGTGAVGLANNAADHALTVGSTTGVSAFTAQAGTGAMTLTAGGAFDVNAVGAVTIDSSGGTIGIGVDAVAQAINIGIGAAARTITIGNATGATSIALDVGTGALNLGTTATAHEVTVGSTTGASGVTLQAGSGNVDCTAALTTTDGVAGGTARRVGGLAYNTLDTSASITSAGGVPDAETAFSNGTYTIPANTIRAGSVLHVRVQVRVSDGAGAATLICRLKLNGVAGTLLANTDTVDVATGALAMIDMYVNGHGAPGAIVEVAWNGSATNFAANDANATVRLSSGIANFATNGALALVVTAQWSGGAGTDDVELEHFSVEALG